MNKTDQLRIHVGKTHEPIILYNDARLGMLTQLTVHASSTQSFIETQYNVIGCYPTQEPVPPDALSNSIYPLRIICGHTTDESQVTYQGKPIGYVTEIHIRLTSKTTPPEKPVIRIHFTCPPAFIDSEIYATLIPALLDLGVEVIVDTLVEN